MPKLNDIRGLSVSRPWDLAFTCLGKRNKRIDNRNWPPSPAIIGQLIVLQASRSWDEQHRQWIERAGGVPMPERTVIERGELFAVTRVTGFVTNAFDSRLPTAQHRWYLGPYCWLLEEFVVLDERIPCSGAQKLWSFENKPIELRALARVYQRSLLKTQLVEKVRHG